MATNDIRVGEQSLSDTQIATVRGDKRGQLIVVGGGGNYQEAAYRGRTFSGANQGPGGTTTTVGLATTYTGLCLSNPIASTVNLAVLNVGIGVVGAPTALSSLGLLAGWATAGLVTHTTPAIAHNNLWNSTAGTNGTGLVDAAATLPATPLLIRSYGTIPITGVTAQVVNAPVSGVVFDEQGSVVLAPGAFVAIYTSTVLTIIAHFTWAEIPA